MLVSVSFVIVGIKEKKESCEIHLYVFSPLREQNIRGSNRACAGIFWGASHTSDLQIGTPVATLPGAWCYRVSAGTGQPSVRLL